MIRLRVRELAEAKGMSIGKLQRMADLSFPTVRKVWFDPHCDMSLRSLEKLASALGVTVAELMEEVPPEQAERGV